MDDSQSLLKKHLTESLWRELRGAVTRYEGRIANCIVAGVENPSLPVGIYACDENAYFQYMKLFYPIIKDLHDYEVKANTILKHDFDLSRLDWSKLNNVKSCVKLVQVTGSRNIEGYSFVPTLDSVVKAEIEGEVGKIIQDVDVKVEVNKMPPADKKKLLDEGLLFERHPSIEAIIPNTKCMEKSFVYYKNDLSHVVWINADDHVQFFVTQKENPDLKLACEYLFDQLKNLETNVAVCQDHNLGYLTCNPANLGTTLRMKVVVQLDKTSNEQVNAEALNGLCEEHKVDMKQVDDKTFEFTQNKTLQLGKTEADMVNGLLQCISEVLKPESELILAEEAKIAEAIPEQKADEKVEEPKDEEELKAEEEKVEEGKAEEAMAEDNALEAEDKNQAENVEMESPEPKEEDKAESASDKYFTSELMAEYADTKTSSGLTIADLKAVSDADPDGVVFVEGIESFNSFNKLYENALKVMSNESFKLEEFDYNLTEPVLSPLELPAIPENGIGKLVKVSRNVDTVPFPAFMSAEDRTKVAESLTTVLSELEVTLTTTLGREPRQRLFARRPKAGRAARKRGAEGLCRPRAESHGRLAAGPGRVPNRRRYVVLPPNP